MDIENRERLMAYGESTGKLSEALAQTGKWKFNRDNRVEEWETTSTHFEKLRNSGVYGLQSLQQLSGQQLFDLGNTLHAHIQSFFRYRAKKILELMLLHFRRRARLLCYFAF